MKKYTDEWLMRNNLTEQTIDNYLSRVKFKIAGNDSDIRLAIPDATFLQIIIPELCGYDFRVNRIDDFCGCWFEVIVYKGKP